MVDEHHGARDPQCVNSNAARLFVGLPYQLGVASVRVWATGPHGEVLLHSVGGQAPACSYPLRSGGQIVGRLELSEAGLRTMTLLDPLLPWIALAVEHSAALAYERRRVAELSRMHQEDLAMGGAARLTRVAEAWGLTPAQTQTLGGLVEGHCVGEIALALAATEATVDVHLTRIQRAAGTSSRAETVARFWSLSVSRQG